MQRKQITLDKEMYDEQIAKIISNRFSDWGKKGGAKNKKKGRKYFKEIGKKGLEKRYGKK